MYAISRRARALRPRRSTSLLLLGTLLVLGSGGAGCAGEEGTNPVDDYTQLTGALELERLEHGAPGVVMAVLENGALTYATGLGVDRVCGTARVGPDTLFPIGELTVPLTTIGLLRLVDAGKVDLDAAVTDYIPELRFTRNLERLAWLTPRHLLDGTSGLPDVPTGEAAQDTAIDGLDAYLTSAAFANTYSLMFPPGAVAFPSTLAADIAGLVIERVTGEPYQDYMQDEVFAPLGMTTATFRVGVVEAGDNYAIGTEDGVNSVTPLGRVASWHQPSTGAFASARDLAQLARFLVDGDPRVLPRQLHDAMLVPQMSLGVHRDRVLLSLAGPSTRGLSTPAGVRNYDFTSLTLTGQTRGQTVQLYVVPERRYALIYLANRSRVYFERSTLEALELMLGEPVAALAQAPELQASLRRYVGTYDLDTGMAGGWHGAQRAAVSLERGTLYMTFDSKLKYALEPMSAGNFRCPSEDGAELFPASTVTFLGDGAEVHYLRATCLGLVGRRVGIDD